MLIEPRRVNTGAASAVAGLVNGAVGTRVVVLTGVFVAAIMRVTVGVTNGEVCGGVTPQAFNGIMISIKPRTAKGKLFVFICCSKFLLSNKDWVELSCQLKVV